MVLIFHKVHGSGQNSVLAVCDKEVCGKTLRSGKVQFVASDSFYKGGPVSEEELREKLHRFGNINIVGNRAVAIAIEEKLVAGENVIAIQGVKHVQIFKI